MADISDVEQAVASTVTSILYPAGTIESSILGVFCRIYRGWPNSTTLNADLSAGSVNVTVTSDNESGRITTRYLPEWYKMPSMPGVAGSVTGQTVIISGNPSAGDVVGVIVDGAAYAYRIVAGDTPGLVAANLSGLIQTNRPSLVQGPTVSVPGASTILVRVVHDSSASFESRRQEKDVRIISWCPTPPIRDLVATALDAAFNEMSFLVLSDDTSARITYRSTACYDQSQNALLYRRDLLYTVEYPTVTIIEQPSMLFGASGINGNITYG
ncbi:hypothetical protein [Rhodopila sp.]|uniref:hypothetical protein n=1 Tax=Rhodopila sp. TaxID=2480087 RepID=UPI003D14E0A7